MMAVANRWERVLKEMRHQHVDAIVTSDIADVCWLTGFAVPHESWPSPLDVPAVAIVTPDGTTLVVAKLFLGLSAIRDTVTVRSYATHGLDPSLSIQAPLAQAVGEVAHEMGLKGGRAMVSSQLPFACAKSVTEIAKELVADDGVVATVRMIKDEEEIASIRACASACDTFQRAVRDNAVSGRSEAEIFSRARCTLESTLQRRATILADFVSGPRCLAGGGPPGKRRVEPGDPVLCDVAIGLDGYWADNCMTIALDEPTSEYRRVFGTVRQALLRSIEACRPGASAADVDAAGRSLLADAGLGFGHHLGHGVGASYHEGPRLTPTATAEIEEGMVICLEPAAFEGTRTGVRLEVVGVVRSDGYHALSSIPEPLP
jgi:Xaa-Pro aminopeptidase